MFPEKLSAHPEGPVGDDNLELSSGETIVRSLISESALFKDVDIEDILPSLKKCELRTVAAGDIVMEAHAVNHQVFLLLKGLLSVLISESGSDPVVINLYPGQSVGEISVIDGQPSSAQVVAHDSSTLLVIDGPVFWSFVEASTQFSHNIMALLAFRIRNGNVTIADSVRLQKQYEHHATVDSLTGLRNRRWFDDMLVKQLNRDAYSHEPTSLIMLDIDNFKLVNDIYGHLAGDQVLSAVASIISSSIRPIDQSARYGGEEFVIILPATPLQEAARIAERLRQNMESTDFNIDNNSADIKLTISMGVAASKENEPARSLVFRSDNALYMAKEMGKNLVHTDEGDN